MLKKLYKISNFKENKKYSNAVPDLYKLAYRKLS